jgi:arsenical pump membrane protein
VRSTIVNGKEILALGIFITALFAVLTRPRNLSEGASAMAGAALMLMTGIVSLGDLGTVLRQNLTVFAFFLGMMTITVLAEGAKLFDRLALGATRLAGGSSRRLFFNIFALGVLISTFLTNDATALILTPVVYALVTRLRLDPLPYVFACTFIADTASMTLPISNPINIILAERFSGMSLTNFLHYLLLPSVAAITINVVAFAIIFRRKIDGRFTTRDDGEELDADERRAFRIAAIILVLVGIAFVVASELHPAPIGVVALGGAAALLLATALQGRLRLREVAGGISWSIFPFIAGMFLMVRGLEHAGTTRQLGDALTRLVGHGSVQPVVVTGLFSAISSNLINNVPAVAVLTSTIPTIHHVPQSALVYGALIGCDLGPNLTVVGSLSTMIWLLLLRQRNMDISALDYAKLGVVVTPIMLIVSSILLALLLR